MSAPSQLPIAPAVFVGIQEGCGPIPDFALFNLTIDLPGHPCGSTVSDKTLRELGFALPEQRAA